MVAARKDVLAPDNEPTDEEFALVLNDALEDVRRRRRAAEDAARERMRIGVARARALRDEIVARQRG